MKTRDRSSPGCRAGAWVALRLEVLAEALRGLDPGKARGGYPRPLPQLSSWRDRDRRFAGAGTSAYAARTAGAAGRSGRHARQQSWQLSDGELPRPADPGQQTLLRSAEWQTGRMAWTRPLS